jgi:hypothetical protein
MHELALEKSGCCLQLVGSARWSSRPPALVYSHLSLELGYRRLDVHSIVQNHLTKRVDCCVPTKKYDPGGASLSRLFSTQPLGGVASERLSSSRFGGTADQCMVPVP